MKSRVPRSKTMRVATALTGMTACAAGFLPTAAAQAAPDNAKPGQPYWLDIAFKGSVKSYQACGSHPGNVYRCTVYTKKPSSDPAGSWTANHVGGNKYSWDTGPITIRWNGGGPGKNDICNTSGAYYGSIKSNGVSHHSSVILFAPNGLGIGNGIPTC
jgi:hypothetical protein